MTTHYPMLPEQPSQAYHVVSNEEIQITRRQERPRYLDDRSEIVGPWSYRAKTARGTIRLNSVEYRILKFLASQPYRAFSRQRIAAAVSTRSQPVTADRLSHYIHSLRRQLGFYGDLIQSVPYIGYRFKA